jgi:hypothetical protein
MEPITGSRGWLVAIKAWGRVIGPEVATYVYEHWWAVMFVCACAAGLSNLAIEGKLHSLYSPISTYWLGLGVFFFAALPYVIVTERWDANSDGPALVGANVFRAYFVLMCLIWTTDIYESGNQNNDTAAIWFMWNSLVAWMPAALIDINLPPWCMILIAYVLGGWVTTFARSVVSDPLPDIPVKPNRFGWLQLDDGPTKSRLKRIGWVVRGSAWSGIVVIAVFGRVPRFTENKAHSTVWQLFTAFATLVPMCLIVGMHFLHVLRSGDAARFAVRYAPTAVLQWLIEQGGAVNGEGPDDPSALALAVLNRNTSKVAILLAAGADVHARGTKWYTPLLCACPHSVDDRGVDASPEVYTSIVGMLIDAGADVNTRTLYSATFLKKICSNSALNALDHYEPIIHMLLDAGADALANNLLTTLHLISTHIPRPRLVDMLLGVIAYQAHLAQHVVPMIEQPNRRIAISHAMTTLREPEVLVHAHAAMRRQAWSRRRGAVVAWHVMANELV